MTEYRTELPFLTGLIGGMIVLIMWIKSGFDRIGIPPLIGYLAMGLVLRISDREFGWLDAGSEEVFGFLGTMGLVTLLFRVGLESKTKMLLKQLQRASIVWIGDVFISGLVGFTAVFYFLELGLITGLVVGIALTATSVGISVTLWESRGALSSPNGSILLDVAELDDISAIVLMALLFATIPAIQEFELISIGSALAMTGGVFLVKVLGFGVFCFIFSRFLEGPLTRYFKRSERPPDPMLTVVGIGLIIAFMARSLGFSLAIGAFFAGLLFSRDPQAVKMEGSFLPVYELFSPFFFIGIGMDMDLYHFGTSTGLAAVLFGVAVLGKLAGDGVPLIAMKGWKSGLLIGASMVPRAEIAMVVMKRGLDQGIVSPQVFTGMVMVSAATCVLSPVAVNFLLDRWPQKEER